MVDCRSMKIQDVVFGIVFIILLLLKRGKWFLYAGLGCFVFAIPLFARWVFFTAERLTWYGSFFIFVYIIYTLYNKNKNLRTL